MTRSFTAKLVLALIVAIVAAVVIAPLIAPVLANFRFPFPRIFDRVVMVMLGIVLIISARSLGLLPMLRRGFARPMSNLPQLGRGVAISFAVMTVLVAVAAAINGLGNVSLAAKMLPKYLLSAVVIAVIEEGFFRAFLLSGMETDFGRTGAIILSSAIYAIAHVIRAPAHFYTNGFDLTAGVHTLWLSFSQLADPLSTLPTILGLFLLGIVLAEGYILTGTVWFSVGLHAGFVIGSKLWPKLVAAHHALPGWLDGWGHQPVISGAAAWLAALAVLMLLRRLSGTSGERTA